MKGNYLIIVFSLFLIFLSEVAIPVASVLAYNLRVYISGGTDLEARNGVDIVVANTQTRAAYIKQYFTLPPPFVDFFFTDAEMPPNSSLSVYAYLHGTRVILNS